jgi:hypothetical protein
LEEYGYEIDAAKTGQKVPPDPKSRPFCSPESEESFAEVAVRFGVKDLLEKWVVAEDRSDRRRHIDVRDLSVYLSMTGYVGTIYVTAFSLMRIEEAWKLRCDCLKVHKDKDFGDIHLLQGETTKTLKDPTAVWVTPSSTVDAINAMRSSARLRMIAASANPLVPESSNHVDNPYLIPRSFDPWTARRSIDSDPSIRQTYLSLAQVIRQYPRLLNREEMVINPADIDVARRINPTIDNEKFVPGVPWVLSWHQFRRTGAVNMFASGIISDFSLQYQLKHATVLMTHYYGQGFSEVALNEETRVEILATMYEVAAMDASRLFDDDFVSSYGAERKGQALSAITNKDLISLRKLVRKGQVAWRETPFGGCTNPGPCEYGGFDHLIHCGGGDGKPLCAHGLFDRSKKPAVEQLSREIDIQLADFREQDPLRGWLTETSSALKNILQTMNKDKP